MCTSCKQGVQPSKDCAYMTWQKEIQTLAALQAEERQQRGKPAYIPWYFQ